MSKVRANSRTRLLRAASLVAFASILPAAASSPDVLTMNGLGPVSVGMTVAAAEKALGAKLHVEYAEDTDRGCGFAQRSDGRDPSTSYMVENGKVTRVDIDNSGQSVPSRVKTELGFGIGSLETDIEKAYGRKLSVQPHPYLEGEGHYLVVNSPDKKRGIIFETDKGKVTSFRGGLYPALSYAEGCM